ncbi:rhodanese-like domain-containing protein [Shewanella glacialimarina]|jgi:phage shock protein E|uniref:rhodanese-like domain-containing protein n=1 Tax=Shewanella glacialimarina TaxID=2590884 RepID=UPI001CF88EF5|nr:rhodanese-like domain-containing protein [Shewanella glacialimarina]UCX04029.1 rhodanese-like domain-containing protein [Shewanella glacialimarina]
MRAIKKPNSKLALLTILATSLVAFVPMSFAKDVTPLQAWQMINQQALVIDVRTTEEFNEGHIEGAINIPFENIVEGVTQLGLKNDDNIVLYCRSGRRSGIADNALTQAGFINTANAGGVDALIQSKP